MLEFSYYFDSFNFGFIYALSYYTNSNLIFYFGIYVCGVLSFIPLWILIGFLLLLINPGKYKEYEMKQLRKKKAEQKRVYFLILLHFLWTHPKTAEEN